MKILREIWGKSWVKVIAGLFLGSYGNGIWNYLTGPATNWLFSSIYTVFAFGSQRLTDNVYREASLGNYDRCSAWIMVFASMVLFILGAELIVRLLLGSHIPLSESTLSIVGASKLRLLWMGLLIGMFISSAATAYEAQMKVVRFEEMMTFARPYINDADAIKLRSRFAIMEGKRDYDSIIGDLKRLAVGKTDPVERLQSPR